MVTLWLKTWKSEVGKSTLGSWKVKTGSWKSLKRLSRITPRLKQLLQTWTLRVILDLWESILDSRSLFRPPRFTFLHWEVISGPLRFDFWLRNVRPYDWVFKIGLWESDFFRWTKIRFLFWIKSACFRWKKFDWRYHMWWRVVGRWGVFLPKNCFFQSFLEAVLKLFG